MTLSKQFQKQDVRKLFKKSHDPYTHDIIYLNVSDGESEDW